jgi:DNA-binding IclR family transcriptional regulator
MPTIDRLTSIIGAFDDGTVKLSLGQVAARAELPRSTTHRILDHLVRQNWLSYSECGYGLGRRPLSWGAGEVADFRLREAAAPVLHELLLETGAVIHLGVLDRCDIVHVDKLGGRSAMHVPTRVGTRYVAADVALGLAALAALPPEEVDLDLHCVRRDGVAVGRGDYGDGLTSVAATIARRSAVGIVLPDSVSPNRYRPLMLAAANRIRSALP